MRNFILLTIALLISLTSSAQIITLLSPTGDGGFETGTTFAANNWTSVVSGTRTWQVGGAGVPFAGSRCAYVGSSTNANGINASAVHHFYRDVAIPAGATNIIFSFYYKQTAVDNTYDYMYVNYTSTANTPVLGTVPGAGYTNLFTNTATTYSAYTLFSYTLPNTLAGTTVRLVFTWRSDGVTPHTWPAIDNVNLQYGNSLTPPSCTSLISPTNGATGIGLTSQTLSWNSAATATGYDVYFGTSATPPLVSSNQPGTTYATGALLANTTYYWQVVPRNSNGPATGCSVWSFTTLNPPSNDLCSGSTNLPCGTTNLSGTTVNSVFETPPGGALVSNYGVWYSFIGDGQQTTISSTAAFDHEMVILTGSSCGSFSILTSQDLALSGGTESFTFTTINSQQYYVYIAHFSTSSLTTGTFTISRTCVPAPTPPVNDACSGATNLPCGTSNLSGTTVNSVLETAPGGGGLASNYGVWYSFSGNGQQTTVSTTGTGGFDQEMTVLYGTSCSSNFLLSSQDASGSNGTESYTFVTAVGVTYYIYVAYWNSSGTSSQTGTFNISRTCVSVTDGPCSNGFAGVSENLPTSSTPIVTSSCPTNGAFSDEYMIWNGSVSGDSYIVSSSISTDWITVRSGSPTGPVVAVGVQPLSFTSGVTGTLYIHITANGGCALDPFCRNVTVERLSVLPIELLYLTGEPFDVYNKILWATSTEINSDYFEVQTSLDGYNWIVLGNKDAAGNSNQEIKYSYLASYSVPGVHYYRLKQVDFNGDFKIYGPIAIENTGNIKKVPSVYLNSLGQVINIDYFSGVYYIIYEDGTVVKKVK